MQNFEDKRCVITGAASGIGRAVALDLAGRGAVLALSDVNEEGLAETRSLIGAVSNQHRYDQLDVADTAAIDDYAAALSHGWGHTDFLFNIAGLSRVGEFADTGAPAFDKVMDVNFHGVVNMTRAFLAPIIQNKGGIINISSIFGVVGVPGQAHYCASKFAVRGFSESLAQELAPKGVRVTCVHPGGVATNIARDAEIDALPAGFKSKDKVIARSEKALRMPPEKAARIIIDGAAKGKRRVLVGTDAHGLSVIQRLFPVGYQWLISKAVAKE